MTEAEARTKWCPFARVFVLIDEGPAVNRARAGAPPSEQADMQERTRCIASGCMAWRWSVPSSGFCGLAGNVP
jgi:hypothetical protein